ncbi:MAG TPA: ABC transporter substrate-binding protein, partial [Halanaerobiales bacterium]|nr:ABC transporter substrate-binding protein [Halanaerobiales bacterium]
DYPDISPVVPTTVGNGVFVSYNDFVQLGEFGGLPDYGQGNEIVSWYKTDKYERLLTKAREWYQAGYILPGAATNQEAPTALVKSGRGAGYICSSIPGLVAGESRRTGRELVMIDLIEPYVTTSDLQLATWGIPRSSDNPEKAMQMLNLMYTDPEVANTLVFGVEGEHFKFDNNDRALVMEDGGYDVTSVKFLLGNHFLLHLTPGEPDDLYEQYKELNENAYKPKLGFIFNQSSVKTEIAALQAVREEFAVALESGQVNPDNILPQFRKRLEEAGLEKVLDEKQRQLDKWLENNK